VSNKPDLNRSLPPAGPPNPQNAHQADKAVSAENHAHHRVSGRQAAGARRSMSQRTGNRSPVTPRKTYISHLQAGLHRSEIGMHADVYRQKEIIVALSTHLAGIAFQPK